MAVKASLDPFTGYEFIRVLTNFYGFVRLHLNSSLKVLAIVEF